MEIAPLEQHWLNLLAQLEADLLLGKTVLQDLVAAHSTPDRHYHNLLHIQYLLTLTKLVEGTAKCLSAIKLAAWFHDYIYDSQAQDNEIKSATHAEKTLTELNISADIIRLVKQIILSTDKHQPLTSSIDNLIFLDLDLSILGASSDNYLQYAAAIRKEYSWLSDRDYRQGRKQVLNNFLAREKIYYTDYFARRLEPQARVNLANEIKILTFS